MTPRISDAGMRVRLGESASKMNLLTPVGTGPTRRVSSSWSCSEDVADPTYVSRHSRSRGWGK